MTSRSQNLSKISKSYDPKEVEDRTYKFWMDNGYFKPKIQRDKKPFVIIMPPPNVTGELHLGHALTAAAEDALVRWHRMKGDPTLWLPGIDHAGIATQVVIEKQLATEGKTRQGIGQDAFVERIWTWVNQYGGKIANQHKRLGASCDWSRETFTLDKGPSLAVRTTFVNLYNKKLIYRGERIINWCPRCATAISDLEVIHQETKGSLYYIKYQLHKDHSKYITVATTRPETLLGDTAIAINPDDERFKDLVGAEVILPLPIDRSISERLIKIIADPAVDPSFGTGAVKVTPAHSPTDFEIAERHPDCLPFFSVIGKDANMTSEAGKRYEGLDRFECRETIIRDLNLQNLLSKKVPYTYSLGHCQRCDTVVEPLISSQWFFDVGPIATTASKAVRDGTIKIVPRRFKKVYLNWMDNIRQWCISRQLWWGHRIPVWYCNKCEYKTVVVDTPSTCGGCGSTSIYQDPDVLDTWFSSGLWPHSTLGWPEETEDLKYFYPSSVLETGYDILFFWVARMVMMGLENMKEIPFETIYLHGLIKDENGEKMSKLKGNVINPLEIIDENGADALRFSLIEGKAPGNDSRFIPAKIQASRNFTNKIWNAARFVISAIDGKPVECWKSPINSTSPMEDRWIISRFNQTIEQVTRSLHGFRLGDAQEQVHNFIWNEYCDWYIEMAKIRFNDMPGSQSPVPILAHILEGMLRLLHPFMPFITEELWQTLTQRFAATEDRMDSIMISPYPKFNRKNIDQEAEDWADLIISLVKGIRNVRVQHKVESTHRVDAYIFGGERLGPGGQAIIERLGNCSIDVRPSNDARPSNCVMVVAKEAQALIPTINLFDMESEIKRLKKDLASLTMRIGNVSGRLDNKQFLSKAPANVIKKERDKLQGWIEEEEGIRHRIEELRQR